MSIDKNFGDTHKYDDIIGLPHYTSKKRSSMSISDRAAQFSPFAALRGYGSAINEAARLTETRHELDENFKDILDGKLRMILPHISERPEITVTYFAPDKKKSGGAYISVTGHVKRLDTEKRSVIFSDNTEIHFDDIYDITGEMFGGYETEEH